MFDRILFLMTLPKLKTWGLVYHIHTGCHEDMNKEMFNNYYLVWTGKHRLIGGFARAGTPNMCKSVFEP